MKRHLLVKLVVLAVVAALLSACDTGGAIPTVRPTSTAVSAVQETPADVPTTEVANDPTPGEVATEEAVIPESPTEEALIPESPTEAAPTPDNRPTAVVQLPLPPLQAGPITVVALGDSLTEGDGDVTGEGGGFPFRLEKAINTIRPDSQVINFGASGWTSQQMVEGQLPQALEAKPQIAVVWIGSNNLWYNNGPGEGETTDLESYTKDIDTTLRSLTAAGAHVFIALLDDQSLRPYSTSPNGGNFTQDQLAQMTRLALKFNDIIRAKAAEYEATTVDFYNTTIFTDPTTLADDGIHPNPAGYDIIAKMWFDAIRKIL